ncbi:phospholipase D-like domain-containing protein [Rhizobium sp. BK376]|uniref:phospholipase D-like domain-containing protein n=1 Tax=Rhizobium sp. BK376 TaxID=2512149 RepID=UPI001053AC16|nr:phospholipase D-like domain-containing protein [Rhizobium sp. BK376]TCR93238.1 phosphatidylserine/phosphatidylglycerophosphate/cardiolipin synthase-like enzyme [Rhizobium sp. BK376]
MTVEDSKRVRLVAQQVADASSPDVQADIDALKQSREQPAWVQEAGSAMTTRYGGLRALMNPPPPVYEEVEARAAGDVGGVPSGGGGARTAAPPPPPGNDETIVFAVGTPVFLVRNNVVDIDSARQEAVAWRRLLTANAAVINRTMVSIGRVDVSNADRDYAGTAWVIDDGLVVTNRHVANLFAEASGTGFKFRIGFDARHEIGVDVDFLEEFGNAASDEVKIDRIVWVAPENGPDIAFLRLEQMSSPVGRLKLDLSDEFPQAKLPVAAVGYPASDSRFSDQTLANKVFGGVFNKKRLAVGNLLGVGDDLLTHSCATFGGNSGSPLLDIGTGKVTGLHYRGVEFIENDAIPAAVLRRCLQRARGLLAPSTEELKMSEQGSGSSGGGGGGGGKVTFTVPLKITIELDTATLQSAIAAAPAGGLPIATVSATTSSAPTPPADAIVSPTKEQVQSAVRTAHTLLANREDVVAIKPGYRFENGEITDQRAVVIAVKRKIEPGALESRGVTQLPKYIDGVRTDVAVASAADMLGIDLGDEAFTPSWHTSYKPRPDLPLTRRKTNTKFVIHSGPDASWPQLGAFLSQTRKSLVVAMYDFGATNVADGVLDAVKNKTETMSLVLQMGGKVHTGDLTDYEAVAKIRQAKGDKFDFAPASVGKTGIFDSAYHIKVAVRDHTAMWLSSGNWQSSNQPNISPLTKPADAASALRLYNREWHAILEDEALSKLYEEHILRDLDDAKATPEAEVAAEPMVFLPADFAGEALEAVQKPRYFEPITGEREIDVQPVLTPDNYIDTVVPFIQSAKTRIFFQNQSFNTKTVGDGYRRLLDALLEKQKAGLDVRVIFRSFGSEDRDTISNAKDYGFDSKTIRIQKNCHTKGIIIDSEAVLVGSHNWTTAGTGFNRDASLIFYDAEIAKFYEEIFLYDWGRIGPAKINDNLPPPIPVTSDNEMAPPPGYVAVPLSAALGR